MDDTYVISVHQKAFAIIPKVGGGLTIIGSIMILRDMALKIKANRTIPLTGKIMTLIAAANLFLGIFENFLSTWMVPKGSPAFMAYGNTTTCDIQGFITITCFLTVQTSYTMLSALYYLTVRRDWTTQKTQSWRVRFSFLALPIIIGLGVAIPLLPTGQYNFSGVYACTISPHPFNCHYDEGIPCTRAPNAMYIREGFFIYVLACMFFIILFISMLAFKVKKLDAETANYSSRYLQNKVGISNPVLFQSLRYVTAFLIPNIAFMIWAVCDIFNIQITETMLYVFTYLYVVLWPLFGFMVSFVYFRLRYLNERKSNPDAPWTFVIGETFTIHSLSIRSSKNSNLPPVYSFSGDEGDLSSPLFEESATAATATSHYLL